MTGRVRTDGDACGVPTVAVKHGEPGADAERLHREARMLALARLPGVIELIELTDHDDGSATLTTRWVGPHSLATTRARSLDQVVALFTAVAETVADLHQTGIVHGRLDSSHVLVDADGRPVLCGFGGAGLVGEPVPDRRRPERAVGPELRPSRDVYGLGRLLAHLLDTLEGTDVSGGRRHRAGTSSGPACRRLLALADQASADDPSCRPSARSLAEAVHAVAPTATLARVAPAPPVDTEAGTQRQRPTSPTPEPPRPRPARSHRAAGSRHPRRNDRLATRRAELPAGRPADRRRRGLRSAAAMAAGVVLIAGVATSRSGPRPTRHETPDPVVTAGTPAGATPDPARRSDLDGDPSIDRDLADTTDLTGTAAADRFTHLPAASPDPCPTVSAPPEAVADPPVCTRSAPPPDTGLVLDGTRYEIGAAGDEVLVGDWTCTGTKLVALVRPAMGDVYVFDRLPAAGAEAPARQVARLESGAHLESGPADPARRCAPLLGRFRDGSTAAITVLPPERPTLEERP